MAASVPSSASHVKHHVNEDINKYYEVKDILGTYVRALPCSRAIAPSLSRAVSLSLSARKNRLALCLSHRSCGCHVPSCGVFVFACDLWRASGAFSEVKRGVNRTTGEEVAIKIMTKSKDNRKMEIIEIEIEVLKRVNHPNVIKLYEIFDNRNDIALVLQLYVRCAALLGVLDRRGAIVARSDRAISRLALGASPSQHHGRRAL